MQVISYLKNSLKALLTEEDGQDGFEYLLVIGGVSAAIVAAIILGGVTGIVTPLITGVKCAINQSVDIGQAGC